MGCLMPDNFGLHTQWSQFLSWIYSSYNLLKGQLGNIQKNSLCLVCKAHIRTFIIKFFYRGSTLAFTGYKPVISSDNFVKCLYFLSVFKLESWKTYLRKIDKATSQYKDCTNKKCACYSDVIDDDLRVWKDNGGIAKSHFDEAAGRGVHYQIINHKLYREKDCMFPFRSV